MLLYFWKAGENKIFHFTCFCFFVSSHDFELLKLFFLAPPKCENCFKLVGRVLRFERGKTKKKDNQNSRGMASDYLKREECMACKAV